jgi:hypothetical protein
LVSARPTAAADDQHTGEERHEPGADLERAGQQRAGEDGVHARDLIGRGRRDQLQADAVGGLTQPASSHCAAHQHGRRQAAHVAQHPGTAPAHQPPMSGPAAAG